ncbi:MAG: ABC transporter permease [Candidatus Nealsonbacteria bacterium]|nr:ABC transporter permease [Candidatus Nealsonbacteria bacterium]
MLGIIIGIAAVVGMMSLGAGAQNLIVGQVMSLGSNNVFIEPGSFDPKKTSMMEAMMEQMEIKTLKISDCEAITKLNNVESASPIVMGMGRVVYKGIDKKISFLGTNESAQKVLENKIVLGREMTETDIKSRAAVAILGYKIKQDLFGDEDPIGSTIRIKNVNFKVIGAAEEVGSQMFLSIDEYIFVPVTAAQKLLLGTDHLNNIIMRIKDEKKLDETIEDVRFLLRERHNIYNPENDLSKDDFRIMSQEEAASTLTSITGIFTLFLSSVGAIALVVGGIGIMNIMLVSVTERTREIGLRKAVGARKKDILLQFLLEAIVLTIIGGIIGIILGIIFSFIGGIAISNILSVGWKFFISLKAIALGFGFSAMTGLVFGIYPARKAAKLNPIEALRYE